MPALRGLFRVLLIVAISISAVAADQSFSLTEKPKYFDEDTVEKLLEKDFTLKVGHATDLLRALLGAKVPLDHPYIIHIIRWKDNTTTVGTDHWYIYDPKLPQGAGIKEWFQDVETQSRLESERIFGSKRLTFVYLHLNARVQTNKEEIVSAFETKKDKLPFKKDAKGNVVKDASGAQVRQSPDEMADLLLQKGSTGTQLTFVNDKNTSISLLCGPDFGGGCVEQRYTEIAYEISVTKKTPQPLADLKTLAGIAFGQGDESAIVLKTVKGALYQALEMNNVLSPSTLAIGGKVGQAPQDAKISERSYTNEGKYWGGFSFAVPINSYKDISFDENNPSLQPKTVKRENIYAVADLYLPRIDLSSPQKRLIPHALAGMPIKNSPLDHLMVGSGIGFNYVEPFVGVVFNRTKQPKPGIAAPVTSNDLETRVVRKLVVGINLPVGTVKKLLSGK
jgi:hypothetical protein